MLPASDDACGSNQQAQAGNANIEAENFDPDAPDDFPSYLPGQGNAYDAGPEDFDEEGADNDLLEPSESGSEYEDDRGVYEPSEEYGHDSSSNGFDPGYNAAPRASGVYQARQQYSHTSARREGRRSNAPQSSRPASNVDPILFQLEPPSRYGFNPLSTLLDGNGYPMIDSKGREYKDFPGLPRRIPSRLDDETLELYTDRTDPRIQHRDLAIRMRLRPGEAVPRENALNMQRCRFRNRNNLTCWTRKTKLPSLRDCLLMEVIDRASVEHNTISKVSQRGIEVEMEGVGILPHEIFLEGGQVHRPSSTLCDVFRQIAALQKTAEKENVPHWIFLPNRLKPKEWLKKVVAAKNGRGDRTNRNKRNGPQDIIFPVELPAASLEWIKKCVIDAVEHGLPYPRPGSLPEHIRGWMDECIKEGKAHARRRRDITRDRNVEGRRPRGPPYPEIYVPSNRSPPRDLEDPSHSSKGKGRLYEPSDTTGYNRFVAEEGIAPQGSIIRPNTMTGFGSSSRSSQLNHPSFPNDDSNDSFSTFNPAGPTRPGLFINRPSGPTQPRNREGSNLASTNTDRQGLDTRSSTKRKQRSSESSENEAEVKRLRLSQQEFDKFHARRSSRPSRHGKNPAREYDSGATNQAVPYASRPSTVTNAYSTSSFRTEGQYQDLDSHPTSMPGWQPNGSEQNIEPASNEGHETQERLTSGTYVGEVSDQDGHFELDSEYDAAQPAGSLNETPRQQFASVNPLPRLNDNIQQYSHSVTAASEEVQPTSGDVYNDDGTKLMSAQELEELMAETYN